MAKCTITFSDSEDSIDVKVEFTPALDNPLHGHKPTPAQLMGWQFFEAYSGAQAAVQPEADDEG